MKNYRDVRLVFIAPDAFQIDDEIIEHLIQNNIQYEKRDALHPILPELDGIYVTRLQSEHDTGAESVEFDHAQFHFGPAELKILKPNGVIMHPLPRGPELDPVVDGDPRAVYWRQERNGMWMRVALLLKIFGAEGEVDFG
jgi:aspartate carbamoyltransferase catalytic subunit